MRRLSWIVQMAPNSICRYLYRREAEGDLIYTEEEEL